MLVSYNIDLFVNSLIIPLNNGWIPAFYCFEIFDLQR